MPKKTPSCCSRFYQPKAAQRKDCKSKRNIYDNDGAIPPFLYPASRIEEQWVHEIFIFFGSPCPDPYGFQNTPYVKINFGVHL